MSNPTLTPPARKMLRHTHRLVRLLRPLHRRSRFVDALAGVETLKGCMPMPCPDGRVS